MGHEFESGEFQTRFLHHLLQLFRRYERLVFSVLDCHSSQLLAVTQFIIDETLLAVLFPLVNDDIVVSAEIKPADYFIRSQAVQTPEIVNHLFTSQTERIQTDEMISGSTDARSIVEQLPHIQLSVLIGDISL